jgi:hemerythrin-like domain-containing protein
MSKSPRDTPEGVRTLLTRDHRELDQLFDALLAALRADARDDALRLWSAFDDGLWRHMALEENELLPLMKQHDEREVAALLKEHQEIRAKLADLGVGIDLHEIPVQTVSDFVEQLRRHASREDALAYRWAQANLPVAQQDAVRNALAATRAVRQRVLDLLDKVKKGRADAGGKARGRVSTNH